jgi:CPA2 family monovalent cation:H+ antiporter-2
MAIDVLAILAAAALVALCFRPFKGVTIPGYLIAGALLTTFRAVKDPEQAQAVWQFATVLLMFTIGLHLDMGGVRGGLVSSILVGVVSTLLSLLIGWPVAMLFGLSAPAAVAISMALSLSSTAVVLRVLEQRRELHRTHGRLAFGVLLIQDMLALAMMALVPVIARWSGVEAKGLGADDTFGADLPAGSRLAIRVAGIALLIVVGRTVFPRLLKAAAWSGETLLVVSAAMALGAAVVTAGLGFSPELGAFLAGFLLAATPFRYQLAGQLVPLRDLFLAVFFTALGLKLPLGMLAEGWWIVLLGVAALLVVKTAVTGFVGWAAGATAPVAAYAGLIMFQGGEFSLVLLSQQDGAGVLSKEQTTYGIAIVVVSLVLTPVAMSWGRTLAAQLRWVRPAPWMRGSALRESTAIDTSAAAEQGVPEGESSAKTRHAIVAGFGPVGRAVADRLDRLDVRTTVIELNPRTVEKQFGLGREIIYGDAANPEVLEKAGIASADAVILTMPDEEAVLRSCRLIRLLRPDVFIAARVNMLSKGLQAMQLGADHTVVEELATAQAMADEVVMKLRQREGGEEGPRLYDAAT